MQFGNRDSNPALLRENLEPKRQTSAGKGSPDSSDILYPIHAVHARVKGKEVGTCKALLPHFSCVDYTETK